MEDEKPERVQSMAEYLATQKAPEGESGQSLAEFLGVLDPEKPLEEQNPVPPKKMTAKQFALGVVESRTYLESILRRILLDTLPPAIELRLLDYARGKPVEQMEVRTLPADLSDLTPEQLAERARQVAERIRDEQTVEAEIVPSVEKEGLVH